MKWFVLLGNATFAVACLTLAVVAPSTAGYTAPTAAVSGFMAFVVWSDCRGEWGSDLQALLRAGRRMGA